MNQTKSCVRCGKPARYWGGFVAKRNGKAVLAGWCARKCESYHGKYEKRMGEQRA